MISGTDPHNLAGVDLVHGWKRCGHCGRWLWRGAFYRRTVSPDGLQSWCNDCHSRRREWHAEIIVGDEAQLIAALGRPGTFATSDPYPAR